MFIESFGLLLWFNQLLDLKAKDEEKRGGGLEEGEDSEILEWLP